MTKNNLFSAMFIVVCLFVAGWVVESSETFQGCVSTYKDQPTVDHTKEGVTQLRTTFELTKFCSGEFINKNGESVSAFFTVVLAISTSLLWWTTSRLLLAARNQSGDMQASIREASRSAAAMEAVAESIAISAEAATESVVTVKERTAMQMRSYVSVLVNSGFFQERDKEVKFGVQPSIVNTGQTPAHDLVYRARTAIFPFPLPDNIVLSIPENMPWLGGAVLGPHHNFVFSGFVDDYIPDTEIHTVMAGKNRRVFIWGTIRYRDVFGETRYTEFSHSIIWLGDSRIFGNYERRNTAT